MKKIVSAILVLSLLSSCSSTNETSTPSPLPPPLYVGENYSGDGEGWAAMYILVYGAYAVIQYIKNGNLKSSQPTESVADGIVLKCYIQSPDRLFVSPCGQFTVDVLEKKTNKTRNYVFTGDDNLIGFVKGKNRISVRVSECGLIQEADEVKAGDIIKLEFPPICRLAR